MAKEDADLSNCAAIRGAELYRDSAACDAVGAAADGTTKCTYTSPADYAYGVVACPGPSPPGGGEAASAFSAVNRFSTTFRQGA